MAPLTTPAAPPDQPEGEGEAAFSHRYETFQAAWRETDRVALAACRRRWGWLKAAAVCWWKHRTRAGRARGCWACTGR